jgi:hypothetical protein
MLNATIENILQLIANGEGGMGPTQVTNQSATGSRKGDVSDLST